MAELTQDQSRAVLQALRDGQVPPYHALELCVGREPIIESYRALLDGVTEGQAAVRFVRGDYGHGKSMLLRVFEEIALQRQFAVARLSVRSELPFNKLEELYRKIVREIQVPSGRKGIEALLRQWVNTLRRNVDKRIGADAEPFELNAAIEREGSKSLREVRQASPGFADGAKAYLDAVVQNNPAKAEAAVTWLRQDPHQRAEQKRMIGVKGNLTRETALEFLSALLRFVRWVPLAGTVILIDEAEYIRNLPQERLRTVAYDIIRALWDDCNSGEIKYTLFVFAATHEMFSDERRGFKSYEALADRMGADVLEEGSDNQDMRWPIVDLPLLEQPQLIELGRRLMELHGRAEGWNPEQRIDDELLSEIAERAAGGDLLGGEVRPREFVRSMVRWLDMVQKRPRASRRTLAEMFGGVFEEARAEEVEAEETLWGDTGL